MKDKHNFRHLFMDGGKCQLTPRITRCVKAAGSGENALFETGTELGVIVTEYQKKINAGSSLLENITS